MSKVKQFSHKGRYAVIEKFKWHIFIYALISAIVCFYLFFKFEYMRMGLLVIAGFISISYTLPIFRGRKRLRDFNTIKIFLIAIVWSFVTDSLPLYEHGYCYGFIFLMFLERALFFIALTLPFDIRDLKVDSSNHVKTIPSIIGTQATLRLSYFLLAIAIMINVVAYSIYHLNFMACITILIAYSITAICIHTTRDKKEDYYFSGILDGMLLLPYLIGIILF